MRFILLITGLLINISAWSQNQEGQYYWISFADKKQTSYSIDEPEAFLSLRAIERRIKQGIAVTENDFPVNQSYLNELVSAGVKIKNTSRWLNAASVICTSETAKKMAEMPFVTSVDYVGKQHQKQLAVNEKASRQKPVKRVFSHKYGYAKAQIEMLKGISLHESGLTGRGKMIAVLDAGFKNVDSSPFFDHLRQNNQLVHSYDMVDSDNQVFETSVHGTEVLSIMAANIPGVMVGTAPDAIYVCIKTEDTRSEFRMDECSWIAGLEYADSLGVDVVNSSVGYTVFNDSKMNYAKEDLDGKTALSSRAAELAFAKGMIIVNSAGNEGNNTWKGLAMPADAPNVLAVGAVDAGSEKCDFSSIGWVSSTSVKPDIAALGADIAVVSGENNDVLSGKGTSYAAPLVSGLIAALWQAFPYATNKQILEAVRKTASEALHPDNETGFGIPNFSAAFNYLQMKQQEDIWVAK